jgi:hypothetical protein
MSDDPQLEALARDLCAMRAEPEPEFARSLDERAAGWLREGAGRRWRLPSLRILAPALAAGAAVAVAVVVIAGGDGESSAGRLSVMVVPQQLGEGEGLSAAPQRDSAAEAHGGEGAFFTSPPAAREGEPLVATYSVPGAARARVRLADRETAVDVPAGTGRLEISTEGLAPGTYELEVTIPPIPAQRTPVEVVAGER